MNKRFAIKGNLVFSKNFGEYITIKDGYVLIENEVILGIYNTMPEGEDVALIDYKDALIIPGMVDLHLHAPQYPNIGLGMDKELLPWLNTYTFPEESKYSDLEYAKKVYSKFVEELWKVGTTRACIFATIHKESTELLMELVDKAGIGAFIGKVNMDRNCPDNIREITDNSLKDTEDIILKFKDKYKKVKAIITPRFVPSCTTYLMKGLGDLSIKYDVPLQSHLSENADEIEFVRKLHPEFKDYTSIYKNFNLLGPKPTIMAHCILLNEDEIKILEENNVYVAHCPNSNCNLASGIAPIRKLLQNNIKIGLATDISGGHSLSMFNVIASAAQSSNLKWIEDGRKDKPLAISELFYLATKGGGSFFGKVGSFEEGYEFDALVIDDSNLSKFKDLSLVERLEKFIYTGDYTNIKARYVAGTELKYPVF